MNGCTRWKIVSPFLSLLAAAIVAGCGSGNGTPQNKSFFTSGSPEADQRADQRMAKNEQLKDEGGASGASAQKAATQVSTRTTLFERLGGQNGINAIVDDWVPRMLADPRVNFERKGTKRGGFNFHSNQSMTWNPTAENVAALKAHFEQFLSIATGGPARYDGKEMRQAHTGRHITNDEFDGSIGDLKASLDKLKIADKEQKELISIVESTRAEVAEER
ncbi:MAG TPA: group 1 truncated hemoglobin [Tepidisphaeraceae bacterium]|jgi:hemoglobin|nr:group 1 truncated hemoglobin [Tepidisphaeraceae bacterium]